MCVCVCLCKCVHVGLQRVGEGCLQSQNMSFIRHKGFHFQTSGIIFTLQKEKKAFLLWTAAEEAQIDQRRSPVNYTHSTKSCPNCCLEQSQLFQAKQLPSSAMIYGHQSEIFCTMRLITALALWGAARNPLLHGFFLVEKSQTDFKRDRK